MAAPRCPRAWRPRPRHRVSAPPPKPLLYRPGPIPAGMRSFVRFLLTVIAFGAAIQQGWLQAGARMVGQLFGAHPELVPESGLDGLANGTIGSFAGTIRSLPDPWYTLTVMTAGIIGVVL